jgi:hypothetical protein
VTEVDRISSIADIVRRGGQRRLEFGRGLRKGSVCRVRGRRPNWKLQENDKNFIFTRIGLLLYSNVFNFDAYHQRYQLLPLEQKPSTRVRGQRR